MEKKKIIIISGIIVTLIILMGSAFAFFTYSKSREAFTLTSNNITATFVGGSNQINFTNAYPISDEYAISNIDKLTYIDFTVSGDAINENESVGYEIFLTEKDGNTLSNNYVKLYLTDDNDNEIVSPTLYSSLATTTYNKESSGKVIYKTKTKGETRKYRLYAWIDQDYSDNTISRTFSFYVNLYAYNDTREGIYKVTFDYNDGVTESTTKYVTYHDTYGELPTPERNGYTFMGWNGKNLFDKSNIDDLHFIVTRNGEISSVSGSNALDAWASTVHIRVKPNTIYIKSGNTGSKTQDYFDIDGNLINVANFAAGVSFLTPSNCYYIKFNLNRASSPYSNVQLEEGATATEYEPYYITSSTKVVQNKDHTLKAIWKEN